MGTPKITQQNPKGRKTGKIDPKSTGNIQNGPWKGRKRPFWAIFGLSRPNKDREDSERVPEGLGRHPGGRGRHLKAFRVILGSFFGGRVPAI